VTHQKNARLRLTCTSDLWAINPEML